MDDFDTDSQCAYPDCDSGNKADSRCGRCRKAYYCSRRCQRKHWKDHKPSCEPVEEPQAGQDGADSSDLKEAHVKLRVEHEELEREHEKLKRHKRDRSLIYQAEIQKLQEALTDTEEEHRKALEEEAEGLKLAAENADTSESSAKEQKHRRERSVYYQEQLQQLQEHLKDAEREKDEALAKADLIAANPEMPPELQRSGHTEDGYLDPVTNKFLIVELQDTKLKVEGVNNRKKEEYLTDVDFITVMGMPRPVFLKKKEWQKQKIKRDKKLF